MAHVMNVEWDATACVSISQGCSHYPIVAHHVTALDIWRFYARIKKSFVHLYIDSCVLKSKEYKRIFNLKCISESQNMYHQSLSISVNYTSHYSMVINISLQIQIPNHIDVEYFRGNIRYMRVFAAILHYDALDGWFVSVCCDLLYAANTITFKTDWVIVNESDLGYG